MALWLVFAILTGAVVAALAWPYLRPAAAREGLPADAAVYRDQLAELERDQARGIIGAAEAEAARNEVSRRLLAATGAAAPQTVRGSRNAFIVTALAVPAVALPLYLKYGSPKLPDVPLTERLANAHETGDIEAMIANLERSVEQNPGDVERWTALAQVYERLQRFGDAAAAYAKLIELKGPEIGLLTSFGEMDTFANGGTVTAMAAKSFDAAIKTAPKNPKARFFVALRLKQAGKRDEARAAFEQLLADSPKDADWRRVVEGQLSDLRGPGAADVQAAGEMPEADRKEMIRGMVEGLDQRLKQEGGSLEDWKKLIRSRVVLGEPDKAKAALKDAAEKLKDKPDELAALDAFAKELGLP